MNIAMTGATGYIGKHLSNYLTEKGGHRIIPLGRAMFREGMSGLLVQTLTHCDVIINLAGAPINQRWTPEHKQELFNSRITVTHRIIRALNAVKTKPKLMISASAVGYYPSLVESDEYTQTRGDGFLSDLCYAWEKEAKRCPQPTRLVITRFGVVLSSDGGAMQQMLRPLRATKVAAVIGPGTQPFPWIDIRDLCRAMAFFIENEELRGVFNLVAPQAVSQSTFTRAMGKAYHAWTTLIVPQAVFRLLYGEAASFLTAGQRVRPTRLLEAGFHFSVPTIEKLFEETDHSIKINIMDYKITHQPEQKLFKTEVDGRTAFVEYRLLGDYLDIIHTIVPKPIEGRGIAAALVKAAYDFALANGMKPKATCSYAVRWLERHPEMNANS